MQRTFSTLDQSFSACIRSGAWKRRPRLSPPGSRLSITEVVALWHFTDSSHFIRSVTRQFDATRAQFARRVT